MADKMTGIEVLIGGKVYRLTGADPAYLQKVAGYMNTKLAECRTSPDYRVLDADYRTLLLNLNIADDYFKTVEEKEKLKKQVDDLEKELYAVRHDVVSTKLKLENSLKQQATLEKQIQEIKVQQSQVRRGY